MDIEIKNLEIDENNVLKKPDIHLKILILKY